MVNTHNAVNQRWTHSNLVTDLSWVNGGGVAVGLVMGSAGANATSSVLASQPVILTPLAITLS